MAGHMGQDTVTVRNLEVIAVNDDSITVKGLVPGSKGSLVKLVKAD
jgi:ribosomal protein L3